MNEDFENTNGNESKDEFIDNKPENSEADVTSFENTESAESVTEASEYNNEGESDAVFAHKAEGGADDDTEGTAKKGTEENNEGTAKKYSYKKSIAVGLAGVLLCGGSLGYCLGLGLNTSKALTDAVTGGFSFNEGSEEEGESNVDASPAVDLTASEDSIVKVIDSVKNSVVNISIKAQTAADWFGQVYESEGSGSGVIYKVDGDTIYIVTNNHVVEDANSVVISITGNEQVNAKLVGKDATSDLAVISVSKKDLAAAGISDVTAAKFGSSDNMAVGENVIAIGNALGQGKTSTLGIISAQNKEINIDGKKLTVIQTDAAINPGNSGGALINTAGEVIGINTAKLSSSAVEGIGYAIPMSAAQSIIDTLMQNGTVDKPYLGISGYTIDDNFERIYGIDIPGIFVYSIESGSAAEKAGLQVSDIITAIDGNAVSDVDALSKAISSHKSGDSIQLTVVRDGVREMTVTAVLQNQNEQF